MVFAVAGGGQLDTGSYQIDNSLRFNDGDNPYLDRTPGSAGNRRTWTWSAWVKRGVITGSYDSIWSAGSGGSGTTARFLIAFDVQDRLVLNLTGTAPEIETEAFFRDVSAWYHIVIALDTTQGTASNRIKFYVNGVQQSLLFGFNLTQNGEYKVNDTVVHSMGRNTDGVQDIFDGYMSEVNFIDGQALDPTSFGEFDSDSGIWKPIQYTGTYGTNGFYLDFENSGSLGADQSGNGNNFTPNNLASTDQMLDTPTNNFCVMNSLLPYDTAQFSQGNLRITQSSTNADGIRGTIGVKTGKWYWEIYNGGGNSSPGIATGDATTKNYIGSDTQGWSYFRDGNKYNNDSGTSYGASFTSGDVIGIALDMDNNQITFYKNNVSQGVAFTSLPDVDIFPGISTSNVSSVTNIANFGQDSSFAGSKTRQNNTDENDYGDFYYTPPSGFLALCTQNLATELSPTIDDGSQYFHTQLYNGNGQDIASGGNVITNDANAGDFQPDWVWIKTRGTSRNHNAYDSTRGVNKYLEVNDTPAENTITEGLQSFDTNGFTVGSDSNVNQSTTIVAWQWKANGGSTSSNTDGSITSTVQANTTAGFSIVTYTGTGSNATVGHGLGVTPDCFVVKRRNAAEGWTLYHKNTSSTPQGDHLLLNSTTATVDQADIWNDTAPTSSVFSVGINSATNFSGSTYVAYCFAEIEGYSKFGGFTGNNSSDGTFVYTGFRPSFVLLKRTNDSTYDWYLYDNKRSPFNISENILRPNLSNTEFTSSVSVLDMLSNGFKLRGNSGATNAGTIIYMAFAENPFVSSGAVPVTAR